MAKLLNGQMVDFIAMDVKAPLEDYSQVAKCQMSNVKCQIESSIRLVANSGMPFELRTTIVPGLHDKESMIKLASQLKGLIQNTKWYLQSFRPQNCLDPKFNKIKPISRKEMEKILAAVKKYLPGAELRGA